MEDAHIYSLECFKLDLFVGAKGETSEYYLVTYWTTRENAAAEPFEAAPIIFLMGGLFNNLCNITIYTITVISHFLLRLLQEPRFGDSWAPGQNMKNTNHREWVNMHVWTHQPIMCLDTGGCSTGHADGQTCSWMEEERETHQCGRDFF